MELKIFLLCAYLLVQICPAKIQRRMDVWVVHMTGGEDSVRTIVEESGFVYVGKLMEGVYHLEHRHRKCDKPNTQHETLRQHPEMVWMKRVDNEKPWTVHGHRGEKDTPDVDSEHIAIQGRKGTTSSAGKVEVPESFWRMLDKVPFKYLEYNEETQTYVQRCIGTGCDDEETDQAPSPVPVDQDGVKNEESTEPEGIYIVPEPVKVDQDGVKNEESTEPGEADKAPAPVKVDQDGGVKNEESTEPEEIYIVPMPVQVDQDDGVKNEESTEPEEIYIVPMPVQVDQDGGVKNEESKEPEEIYIVPMPVQVDQDDGVKNEESAEPPPKNGHRDDKQDASEHLKLPQRLGDNSGLIVDELLTPASIAKAFNVDGLQADGPQANRPQADQPQSDQPQSDQPQSDQPQSDQPQSDQPQPDQPQTDQPQNEQTGGSDSFPFGGGAHVPTFVAKQKSALTPIKITVKMGRIHRPSSAIEVKVPDGFHFNTKTTVQHDMMEDEILTPKQAPGDLLPDITELKVAADSRRTDAAASSVVGVREDTQTGRAKAEPEVPIGLGVANPFSSLNAEEDTATGGRLGVSGRGTRYIRYGDLDDGEDREGSGDDDGKRGPAAIYGKQTHHRRTRHGHGEAWCTQKMAARYHHDVCEVDFARKLILGQECCVCW